MTISATHRPFPRAARVLVGLALAALAVGCGLDPPLGTAADEAAPGPAAKGNPKNRTTTTTTSTTTPTSTTTTRPPIASPTDDTALLPTQSAGGPTYENAAGRTVSGTIGIAGGVLRMKETPGTGDPKDDLIVEFTVPAGALDQNYLITMTVYGNKLSELVVAFQPGGLRFITTAQLLLKVGFDRVDTSSEAIIVWHEYGDGTIEQATLLGIGTTGVTSLDISVGVTGFSRYGLRG